MKRLNQTLLALTFACVVYAESQAPNACLHSTSEVVVWVNEQGVPISTETNHIIATSTSQNQAHPTAAQVSISTPRGPSSAAVQAATEGRIVLGNDKPGITQKIEAKGKLPVLPQIQISAQLQLEQHPHAHHHPPPPPHPHPEPHRQFGISYSPYKADQSCKTQDQINQDFDKLTNYNYVRIYGTDCDQIKLVTNAARERKMQVFAGLYDLTDFPNSLSPFSEAITSPDGKKDWSVFHTIAIGNELVNSNKNSPGEVTKAVKQARTILRGQGYTGPVVTVDTFSILLDHPQLCLASDYCAANCHAFFDATQHPHNAGPYVLEQAHSISQAAGGKHTLITESGWPHAGQANGAAVPSPENQRVAIESLRRSFAHRGDDLVLFTAFDDLWKDDNRYTFNAERFWGILH